MVTRTFIVHGNGGTAFDLTFQVEKFFRPSITQEERELGKDEPKPVILLGHVTGGKIQIGDKIIMQVGNKSITDTVSNLQENKANIAMAIEGQHVAIVLQKTSLCTIRNFTKKPRATA